MSDERLLRIKVGRLTNDLPVLEAGWDQRPFRRKEPGQRAQSPTLRLPAIPLSARQRHEASFGAGSTANSARSFQMDGARAERLRLLRERDQELLAEAQRRLEQRRLATKAGRSRKREEAKQRSAAVKIQAGWRGHQARIQAKHLQQEKNAAIVIQSSWRGFKARRQAKVARIEAARERAARRSKQFGSPKTKALKSPKDVDDFSSFLDDDEEPTEEEKKMLQRQFRLVDADSSGDIDRMEFAVFYNLVATKQLSRAECDALFDLLDVDGSGALTLEEFYKVFRIIQKRESLKHDVDSEERLRRLNERLAAKAAQIQASRDAVRRCKEEIEAERDLEASKRASAVAKARNDAKHRQTTRQQEQQKKLLAVQLDKDHEQRLLEIASQKREIELFIHKAEVKAQRIDGDEGVLDEFTPEEIEVLKHQFQKVDTDHSGAIDREEFAVFYNRVSIDQLSANEAGKLFDELDADGSGALTFDEFVSVYVLLQRRERARKDPTQAERVRRMNDQLAEKAKLIAKARQASERTKLEAAVARMNESVHRRALHNKVVSEKQLLHSPKGSPKTIRPKRAS